MSVLGNAKSNRHRKTYQVEPGGTDRKYMFLPGEILLVRAGKKSAEAVVAMKPAERQEEQRAEESRKNHNLNLIGQSGKTVEALRRRHCDDHRSGRQKGQVDSWGIMQATAK